MTKEPNKLPGGIGPAWLRFVGRMPNLSMQNRKSWAFLLFAIAASGCAHDSPRNSTIRNHSVASLNAKANDPAADADEKCLAIFSLFRDFLKLGSGSQEIHEVLIDCSWLQQTNIQALGALGGTIPLQWKSGKETPFQIRGFPTPTPPTGGHRRLAFKIYFIYFTLSGRERSVQSAFDVLTGRDTDEKARLVEFTLCYPDGTVESVSKRGTHKCTMEDLYFSAAPPNKSAAQSPGGVFR